MALGKERNVRGVDWGSDKDAGVWAKKLTPRQNFRSSRIFLRAY